MRATYPKGRPKLLVKNEFKAIAAYLVAAVLLTSASVFLGTDLQLRSINSSPTTYQNAPLLIDLPPKYLNLITLGHPSLYHDYLNFYMIGVLTDQIQPQTKDHTWNLIQKTLSHRIKFETFYMLSCFTMAEFFSSPESCQKILKIGLEVFPSSFRLAITQGYVYAFKLNQPDKAAEAYLRAAMVPNAPSYALDVASKLFKKANLSEKDLINSIQSIAGNNPQIMTQIKHLIIPK